MVWARCVRPEDEAVVKALLGSVGHGVCVVESLLDAVHGLIGQRAGVRLP